MVSFSGPALVETKHDLGVSLVVTGRTLELLRSSSSALKREHKSLVVHLVNILPTLKSEDTIIIEILCQYARLCDIKSNNNL